MQFLYYQETVSLSNSSPNIFRLCTAPAHPSHPWGIPGGYGSSSRLPGGDGNPSGNVDLWSPTPYALELRNCVSSGRDPSNTLMLPTAMLGGPEGGGVCSEVSL